MRSVLEPRSSQPARPATPPTLRGQLSNAVATAAGPYGYTISLGGSIAVAADTLGTPHLGGALLLMAGAVLAFVALELTAQGSVTPHEVEEDHAPSIWGNAHVLSAGGALCAVWAVVHVVDERPLGWGAAGFTATAVYFVVTALQRRALASWMRRRARRRA